MRQVVDSIFCRGYNWRKGVIDMKRIMLALIVSILMVLCSAAIAETYMLPLIAVDCVGCDQLDGQIFVTELVDGKLNIDAFMLVENNSGTYRQLNDGVLVIGDAAGRKESFTLYARDPIAVRNRELVLYSGSAIVDMGGAAIAELAAVGMYNVGDADYGVGLARYMDLEITEAKTPGAKKLTVKAKDIQKGNYTVVFIVYDQQGKIVFAESEIMSAQHTSVSCYIEDRELRAMQSVGSEPTRAAALLYTRPNN